jgi:hypothetical protein
MKNQFYEEKDLTLLKDKITALTEKSLTLSAGTNENI